MQSSRSVDYLTTLSSVKASPKWSLQGRLSPRLHETPGPGVYSSPSTEKFKHKGCQSHSFGTSPREIGSRHGAPGPGQYSPADPRHVSSKFGFGTSLRQSERAGRASNPGPGTYTHKETLGAESPQFSVASKREGVRPSPVPGPGAYPSSENMATAKQTPQYGFGTSTRNVRSQHATPGPGTYGSDQGMRGPRFSLSCRRELVRYSQSPGPGAYCGAPTSFGY